MWPADDAWRAPVGDFPPPWASAWGDDLYGLWADLTVNGVSQRMRWIEPSGPDGFLMGARQQERDSINNADVRDWANEAEGNPTPVVIQQGFWLADTPCTQAFWTAAMGDNPSHFGDRNGTVMLPVENVDVPLVESFIYRFASTSEWGCGVRLGLPTETQWEYAARAGSTTAYWWGDEVDGRRANWNQERGGTTPVKQYGANPWGLFDLHGNVWEWCVPPREEHGETTAPLPDPVARVVRGGSWSHHPGSARSAFRGGWRHGGRARYQGFRFLLSSPSQQESRALRQQGSAL